MQANARSDSRPMKTSWWPKPRRVSLRKLRPAASKACCSSTWVKGSTRAVVLAVQSQGRDAGPGAAQVGARQVLAAAVLAADGVEAVEVDGLRHRVEVDGAEQIVDGVQRGVAQLGRLEVAPVERVHAVARRHPGRGLAGPQRVLAVVVGVRVGQAGQQAVEQFVAQGRRSRAFGTGSPRPAASGARAASARRAAGSARCSAAAGPSGSAPRGFSTGCGWSLAASVEGRQAPQVLARHPDLGTELQRAAAHARGVGQQRHAQHHRADAVRHHVDRGGR
jgi:hypothetical protein